MPSFEPKSPPVTATGKERLLSKQEAADRCGLNRRAIDRAVQRGDLPCYRWGQILRIDPDELHAWVTAHRKIGTSGVHQPPATRGRERKTR